MAEPEIASDVDVPDPLTVALGGAVIGVLKVMTLLTGKENDPAIARILATFAVGAFIKAGGMKLSHEQANVIAAMQDEILEEGGLSGLDN